jgi:hypothetical protein
MPKNLFERTIVGFDLRKNSSLNSLFMTSYDQSVRYEEINEQFQDQQSGLNLFYIDPADIPSLEVPGDARIIAFDLPTEVVTYLSNGNVSNPQPLPRVNMGKGWKFMGFDVVDARTQTSAFHGFDLAISLSDVMKKYSFRFNSHGLIDDEEVAVKVAKYFDELISEHAPFMPCGVWLKQENGQITLGTPTTPGSTR